MCFSFILYPIAGKARADWGLPYVGHQHLSGFRASGWLCSERFTTSLAITGVTRRTRASALTP